MNKMLMLALSSTIAMSTAPAMAQQLPFSIEAGDLKTALDQFGHQAGRPVIYKSDDIRGLKSRGYRGNASPQTALRALLADSGFDAHFDPSGAVAVRRARGASGRPKRIRVAQTVPLASTSAEESDDIVVTGSRIATGKGGPNPVTTVAADELAILSRESVPAGLAKLPVFQPVKSTNSASDGGYQPTGNYLDLWGLSPIRTLVLLDGRRISPTYVEGTTDINTLPQMLVQRVEVVTGGASAVYGSDAVAGVANVILDKNFHGLKAQINGGISSYGDGASVRLGIAHGFNIGDRAHFEWSADYFRRDLIMAKSRAFSGISASVVGNGTAASPLEQVTNSRLNSSAFGGLVTNGPFAGQQFLADGTLAPFNRGVVTQSSGISIGGDGTYRRPTNLLPSVNTAQFFGRFDYDVGSDIKAYVQGSFARTNTLSHNQNLISTASSNGLTIYSGNPYLRPEYQARLTATNTPSFNVARYNEDFGNLLSLHNRTTAYSVTAGLNGGLFSDFVWDAWYTHGVGRIAQFTANNTNTQRLYAALDAVRDPTTGNIVCRVTLTAPAAYPGCVPINVMGVNTASPEAIAYVNGDTAWTATNTMDDLAATLTGSLLEGWAGPIKVAFGAEYRRQTLRQTSTVVDNSFNPQYLRVGLNGSTPSPGTQLWTKNISAPTYGAQSVYEGNVELNVPLLRDSVLAKSLSLSAAGRVTHYTISGTVNTWRLGLDWRPVSELRIRGTRSRDIRAPTLYELYQGETRTISGFNDYLTNANGQILNLTKGNPDLVPEVARNITVGASYQPSWLRGFTLSFDYFDVKIGNAIATVNGMSASTQRICVASGGTSPLCDLVVRPFPITNTTLANAPTLNIKQNENVARVRASGFVVNVGYGGDLSRVASTFGGVASVNVQWTHQPVLKSLNLPGTQELNTAGTALAPADRIATTLSYALGGFNSAVTVRYFSPFRYSPDPTLIIAQPRSNAYFQADLDLSYDFKLAGQDTSAFLNVNNLFNAHGGLYATSASNPGLLYPAAPFADQIGRYFRLGLKISID